VTTNYHIQPLARVGGGSGTKKVQGEKTVVSGKRRRHEWEDDEEGKAEGPAKKR
jgi:hypothetical protein